MTCEWNPEADEPAVHGGPCHNPATVSVGGDGEWYLCSTCAELPRFRGYSQEPLEALRVERTFHPWTGWPVNPLENLYPKAPMPRLPGGDS